MDAQAVAQDFLERAGWSAGQTFLSVLLAGGSATVVGLPWEVAALTAIGAAVGSLVLTGLQYLGNVTDLSFWPDLLVRLAKTFLSSLAASFGPAAFNVATFAWSDAFNVAVLASLTALAKGLLARGSPAGPGGPGGPDGAVVAEGNPSTLPTRTYAAAVERR